MAPTTLGIPLPLAALVAFAFLIGASIGSFLNVVIARVPFGQSVVWPPSHCMSCGTAIRPFHNVPILSWFWLRGRCRTCLAPFSVRYAAIELLFALVCAFAVARHGLSLPALREVLLMGFLVPLTFMDLDWWVLPRELTWSGVVVGLLLALAEGFDVFQTRLLGAAIGWCGLLLVGFVAERVMKKEAMGRGDPPLMGLIGAFLGPQALLLVLLLSSVQSVLVGLPLILLRRQRSAGAHDPVEEGEGASASKAAAQGAEVGKGPGASAPTAPDKLASATPGSAAVEDVEDEDDWVPDPTAVPYGPFLSLAAAEVLYFTGLTALIFRYE